MGIEIRCDLCGACCKKKWTISLNLKDIKRLQKIGFDADYFAEVKNGLAEMKRKGMGDFDCIFLENENICRIQKKFGAKHQPDVCRDFPYNEPVCGMPIVIKGKGNKKIRKALNSSDVFFQIGAKAILVTSFRKMILKLNSKKPLFDSYYNLILNILGQKEGIILNNIKIKNLEVLPSDRTRRKIENMFLKNRVLSFSPYLNKLLKKDIKISLPTQDFSFKFIEEDIPESAKKEFIKYLSDEIKFSDRYPDYPLKLMVFLYFLSHFAKSVSKGKKMQTLDVVKAFSLLNSANRFGEFRLNKIF